MSKVVPADFTAFGVCQECGRNVIAVAVDGTTFCFVCRSDDVRVIR